MKSKKARVGGVKIGAACHPLESRLLMTVSGTIIGGNTVAGVFDEGRQQFYLASGGGQIERYDLQSHTQLQPIVIGSPILGLDITPDGSSLYTTLASVAGSVGGALVRIDLPTGGVTRIPYTLEYGENGGFDVAIAADGRVYFDGTFGGSGWTPLHVYDPATNAFTASGSVRQSSQLELSGDRIHLFLTESNISNGPMRIINTATGTIEASRSTDIFLGGQIAVDRTGKYVAIGGMNVFDRGLNTVMSLSGVAPAFQPGTSLVLGLDVAAKQIVAKDVLTGLSGQIYDIDADLGGTQFGYSPSAPMRITADGLTAFVPTPGGYLVVPLTLPGPPPATVMMAATVAEGSTVAATASVASDDTAGLEFEWDFDYDGTVFTVDAAGQAVSFPAGDGPRTVRVAARVRRGSRYSETITERALSVENQAPTAALGGMIDSVTGELTLSFVEASDFHGDETAGLKYSYDLDGDDVFEIENVSTSTASATVRGGTQLLTPHGRITDKDGASTTYALRLGTTVQAVIEGGDAVLAPGQSVTLDGSASRTTGSAIVAFEWDLSYDGQTFEVGATGTTLNVVGLDDNLPAARTIALRITTATGTQSIETTGMRLTGVGPQVRLVSLERVTAGSEKLQATVEFSSPDGVALATVGDGDLVLESPAVGVTLRGQLASSGASSDGSGQITATFEFSPPNKMWLEEFKGSYALFVPEGAATTDAGVANALRELGQVAVDVAPAIPANVGADLIVSLVDPPVRLMGNKKQNLTALVRNIGTVATNKASSVRFVFSSDKIISPDDVTVAVGKVKTKLKASGETRVSGAVLTTEKPVDQQGFLLAVIDPEGNLSERLEVNNTSPAMTTTLMRKYFVDLSAQALFAGPKELLPGMRGKVSARMTNVGNYAAFGSAGIKIELVREEAGSYTVIDDQTFTDDGNIRLKPGASFTLTNRVGNYGTFEAGTYRIRFTVAWHGLSSDVESSNDVSYSNSFLIPA